MTPGKDVKSIAEECLEGSSMGPEEEAHFEKRVTKALQSERDRAEKAKTDLVEAVEGLKPFAKTGPNAWNQERRAYSIVQKHTTK